MQELGLRNNQITRIDRALPKSLTKLDLYDNLIHRIQNLDDLENLTSLDLSYNKIKHIKGVKHLKKLKELFFVQNGISRIEELDGLSSLTSLELGANRIRVDLHQVMALILGNCGSRYIDGIRRIMAWQEQNYPTQGSPCPLINLTSGIRQSILVTTTSPSLKPSHGNLPHRLIPPLQSRRTIPLI
jgi:hypothetical protein